MPKPRPALFRGRHFEDQIIILCVRWYLRYCLTYRDLEELMAKRGLRVDHSTIARWVLRYGPDLHKRIRRDTRLPSRSWRVDETYVRVAGKWTYLYRAVDSSGYHRFHALAEAGCGCGQAFSATCVVHSRPIQPSVINVDGHPAYPLAIAELKANGALGRRCRCRPSPYLNNVLEQDHRFLKKRIAASLGFRSVDGALRTIQGYEAMNKIRKGPFRWLAKGDVVEQVRFINQTFGIAA